ncbi:uncharacterized protein (TIGR04255 family) [Rhodopirellula rubra]|uniref:Uncharacterized protein (TIGR04255 family) n=1 Tax=Aporhodopirellula rubra TaxID=980271 RepID=A0A7W5DUE9_9BACT|nr:TIGR04255 family protein [Aporhodopirellula rubra]MBB3204749.1 uncharacterized protein (TIGR04255 family) [Aporhodopirellula rubra]
MGNNIHYVAPPIREAILNFRCPSDGVDFEYLDSGLETLANQFAVEFPVRRNHDQLSSIDSRRGNSIVLAQNPERFVWQIRRDGMLLSRLPIYDSWGEVEELGRRLWAAYRSATSQPTVSELVVRAINELHLPAGQVNLQDFVRTYPHVSDSIDEPINRFAMNVGFPIAQPIGQASLTVAPGASHSLGSMALLLDITVSCRDVEAIEADCWGVAKQLRAHRNRLFEASITDKMRETFHD